MNDIHTHLYWHTYDADRDAVVGRAREADVKEMLVIGCTVEESRQAIAVAEQYEGVYASVGIHPHFFNELVEKEFSISNFQFSIKEQFFNEEIQKLTEKLRELAQNKKVVAIGECGLDYYAHPARNATHNVAGGDVTKKITEEQKVVQRQGFLAQIALAQELQLPLILHCRDAYEDMFEILRDSYSMRQDSCLILHCYMGDTVVTQKFLTLPNIYFSFTGNITYPVKKAVVGLPAEATRLALLAGTKDDLTETVRMIPLERIFAETDCPFLAPQAHRGKRNEPAFVKEVLECIARLQGQGLSVVERATEMNFKRVFSKT